MTALTSTTFHKLLFDAALGISDLGARAAGRLRQLFGLRGDTHVIICGSPRSGTSMFCNMLAATLQGFEFDYKDEHSSLQTIRRKGNHVSKSPLDVLKLPQIVEANIHRKRIVAIIMIRDPRDIVTSVHENVPGRYFIGYDASCRVWGNYPKYQYAYDHVGLGEIHDAIGAAMELPRLESVILHYESLVSEPQSVQAMLAERFGWSFDGCFSDYHDRSDRHVFRPERTRPLDESLVKWNRPVSDDWVSRWKRPEHHERIIEQFDYFPQLFDMLIEYGYESDRAWYDEFLDARTRRRPSGETRTAGGRAS